MKKTAVFNDISGFGKCSLTAAIPVLSALGVQACPLPTAVFSNQTGYPSYFCRELTEDLPAYIAEWKKLGASFDAILTGFVSDVRQIGIIEDFCRQFRTGDTLLVVDPVMADNGEIYAAYSDELCVAVKRLAMHADIITPNLTEFAVLTGTDFAAFTAQAYGERLPALLLEAAQPLLQAGIRHVIVTSVPAHEGKISNCIINEGGIRTISATAFDGSFSGTGDLFSAAVCGGIVKGETVEQAVQKATLFLETAIRATILERTRHEEGICFEPFLKLL